MEVGLHGETGANAVLLAAGELKGVIGPAPTPLWPMVANRVRV